MATTTILQARLPTTTPIEGCELTPYILLRRADGSCTTEDTSEDTVHVRWFRSAARSSKQLCSIHPHVPATLLLLGAKTYHCSNDCFRQGWREYHQRRNSGQAYHDRGETDFSSNGNSTSGGDAWVEVATGRAYTPLPEDVGHALKFECVPIESGTGMELSNRVSVITGRVLATPPPPSRARIRVVDDPGEGKFSVLTYNVLADLYANGEMYSNCPKWALAWNYRKQAILRELLAYDADILALQEVQSNHYEEFFAPELQKHGYTAVYKKKTAQVFTGTSYTIDGCATFFKKERFTLIKKYEVEFNKAALSLSESLSAATQKKDALSRLMKDNVALIVVLEALEGVGQQAPPGGKRQLLCVANTHIHANPELKDVKLWQVHTLLKGLEKIAASAEIPMVVCGDFNSTPGSAAHSLLQSGRVDAAHPELATDPLGILRPPSKLCHQLPLVSAYTALATAELEERDAAAAVHAQRERLDPATGEPAFTNCTADFLDTLDYIFYTADSLQPVGLLELPSEHELREKTADAGIPNASFPSDHVALLAQFRLL
mmetsp:Transcript_1127/g.4184  ORF Transcript_1127/g.4184 Transcript_1127/m.4184 type:complete len:548 (-) Transcript_1127:374-2017(-)